MSNMDGSSPEVVVELFGTPFGMALDGNTFFWTDVSSRTIYRTVTGSPSTSTAYLSTGSAPFGISLYDSTRTDGNTVWNCSWNIRLIKP